MFKGMCKNLSTNTMYHDYHYSEENVMKMVYGFIEKGSLYFLSRNAAPLYPVF